MRIKNPVWVRFGYGLGISAKTKAGALENQGLLVCGKQDLNLQVRTYT